MSGRTWPIGYRAGVALVGAMVLGAWGCLKPSMPAVDEQPLGKSATQLGFVTAPAGVRAGVVMAPVSIAIQDASGVTVGDATNQVLVALGAGSPSHVLGGTLAKSPTNGLAVFDDLRISVAGGGYTLVGTAPNLVTATSASFTVDPP